MYAEHYQREAIFILNEALKGVVIEEGDSSERATIDYETGRCVLNCYLDTGLAADVKSNSVARLGAAQKAAPRVSPVGEWTTNLLVIEGLGTICRLWGGRLGASSVAQIIVHAASRVALEDRLGAHVLYFCLSDIAAGQVTSCGVEKLQSGSVQQLAPGSVHHLLSRHIGQLAKDLNLLLRRRQGPGPGLHTLLR